MKTYSNGATVFLSNPYTARRVYCLLGSLHHHNGAFSHIDAGYCIDAISRTSELRVQAPWPDELRDSSGRPIYLGG